MVVITCVTFAREEAVRTDPLAASRAARARFIASAANEATQQIVAALAHCRPRDRSLASTLAESRFTGQNVRDDPPGLSAGQRAG